MYSSCSFDPATGELRIRVADTFDVEEAKACMQRFRGFKGGRVGRLVFDLSKTQHLHTAGLGTMLYIRSCCPVSDENAHIVFHHPSVGMILRLANLDRWFRLIPEGPAQQSDVPLRRMVRADSPARLAS